jgi:hypothetical protein
MDDMSAFDRQISSEVLLGAGPSESVDDLAVFDVVIAASRSLRWGFSMFSVVKFIAAGAIVALFGGFLLAGILTTQPGDEVVPAAVTGSPSPMTTDESWPWGATRVTGTVAEDRNVARRHRSYVSYALNRHGSEFETTYRWSDPRLPEAGWSVRNLTYYGGDAEAWGGSVWSGTMGLEGRDGSWVGTITGMQYPDGTSVTHAILTGEDAYAGLTAILDMRAILAVADWEQDVSGPRDDEIDGPILKGEIEGLIFKGPLPPTEYPE